MNKKKGFTLIELLLVLQIISICSYITYSKTTPKVTQKTVIIQQLTLHIEKARLNSLSQSSYTKIDFCNHDLLIDEKLAFSHPKLLFIEDMTIIFTPNGTIQRANTIEFYLNNKEYRLIFNVGQGVFRCEEV